jgi:hypothetical protein
MIGLVHDSYRRWERGHRFLEVETLFLMFFRPAIKR